MGRRMFSDSLFTSESIADLTDFEFRMWVSLILMADDAGRGDARPAIIKGQAFPFRDQVAKKDITATLESLAGKERIGLYEVGGKPYYFLPGWNATQRIDRARPKYPAPIPDEDSQPQDADASPQIAANRRSSPQAAETCGRSPQIAADCRDLPQAAATCGIELRTKNSELRTQNEKEKESTRARRFTPPTVEEVDAYAKENGLTLVDPARFVDFYASKGWKVGSGAMKDWRAAARNWQRREEEGPSGSAPKGARIRDNPALHYEQREYKNSDFGDGFFIDLEAEYGDGKKD